MFKNYLKIAWRGIKKEKLFTFIKIGGFAVGIAACLLIALFISDEISYDSHYAKTDRLYRVVLEGEIQGETLKSVHFQLPFADALQSDFPEIVKAGKYNASELFGAGDKTLRVSGTTKNLFEDGFVFADQNLLDILEIPLVKGNPKTALTQPYSIVISAAKARKYFPDGDALGQTLVLDNNTENPYTITGVMENRGYNSHFDYDFLMEIDDENMSWTNTNYFTYVLLDKNANVGQLEKKMHSVIEKYVIPAFKDGGRGEEFVNVLKSTRYTLQPISDIHLKSDLKMGDGLKHGDIRFVWLFGGIACFVLLLACINFINLSTAKSANRAKEVGLRKTVGAFRGNLVKQLLTEAVLLSLLSFVLGILIAWALLPFFNSVAAKSLAIPWAAWWFVPVLLASAIIIGMLAGLYPALYLSAFRPANVLQGSVSKGAKSGKLRSGLVVFQFTTSIVLIIGTIIIYQQMDYIMSKKLGYEKDQVLVVQGTGSLGNQMESFKERLLALADVTQVTVSDYLPVEGTKRNGNSFRRIGARSQEKVVPSQIWRVDFDYLQTLGLQITEGRDFSKELASDSTGMIINEAMRKELGFENPIGEKISNGREWTIVGVIDDFHFRSLKEEIGPLTMVIGNSPGSISVKLASEDVRESVAAVGRIWADYMPDQTLQYSFLDQAFAKMHDDVQRMGSIFNSFAIFAVFVACLGLFALSAFMVEQRRKEIGIRRVLGAPFRSIYALLTWDFIRLILVAIVLAAPIGWYAMSRWLENFTYRIDIPWWTLASAAFLAIGIAVLTVSFQSILAALANPVKSLRTE